MNKFNCLLFALLTSSTCLFSQSWEWANGYGSGGYNYVHSIKETTNGDLLVSGIIQDTTIFGNDTLYTNGLNTLGYLTKLTSDGIPIWGKSIFIHNGTAQSPAFTINISIASNNSIFLSSHFKNMLVLGNDTLYESEGEMFISLLDTEGNFQWAKNFGDSNPPGFNIVQASKNYSDHEDNIYLTGTFHDTAYFQTDTLYWQDGEIFIVKFDKYGNEKWVRQCGKAGGWQRGYDITVDRINNVYLTGVISSGQSQFGSTSIETAANRNNTYLTKLDSLGNFQWAITGGGIYDHPGGGQIVPSTYGTAIKTDGKNNVYFTGFFEDTVQFGNNLFYPSCGNEYCHNFFLASYDFEGSFNWFAQTAIDTPSSSGNDVEVDEEGNIYVSGLFRFEIGFNNLNVFSINGANSSDLFVAKFDTLGQCVGIINSDTRTTNAEITLSCLNQSVYVGSNYNGQSGNLAVLGVEESQNQNIFIGAISNSFDCDIVSSSYEMTTKDPIINVYPNPFRDFFQIDFFKVKFNSDQQLDIRIFNSLGQLLHTEFVDNEINTINCSHLANGLYYVQIYDKNGKNLGESMKAIKIE